MNKFITMVAIASIASLTSFGQVTQVVNKTTTETKVLTSQLEVELKDGLEQIHNVSFKILSVDKFDSIAGNKSYELVNSAIYKANLELMYSMKDKFSYKPLKVTSNDVMYFNYKGEQYVVVSIACEAKNGYGNPISKQYRVWLKYNSQETEPSKSLTYYRAS